MFASSGKTIQRNNTGAFKKKEKKKTSKILSHAWPVRRQPTGGNAQVKKPGGSGHRRSQGAKGPHGAVTQGRERHSSPTRGGEGGNNMCVPLLAWLLYTQPDSLNVTHRKPQQEELRLAHTPSLRRHPACADALTESLTQHCSSLQGWPVRTEMCRFVV